MKSLHAILTRHFLTLTLIMMLPFLAVSASPEITNIRASQRSGTFLVDIFYDLRDADGDDLITIHLQISADGGASFNVPVYTVSGDIGENVMLGSDRHIVWNAGIDWGGRFSDQCKVKIIADDGSGPPAPSGMVLIPAGSFQMGDSFSEGELVELPLHNVFVSGFFMDRFEVNRELWRDVFSWGQGNDYKFENSGSFSGSNHPVNSISWFDAVRFCNARSEKEGLTPVYYINSSKTTVFRGESLPIGTFGNDTVMWDANGYRLPTEAEWEKAARGGLSGRRFPWGDNIEPNMARYENNNGTVPVGTFDGIRNGGENMANGYGLYDMAGNVFEWCWDGYRDWYGNQSANFDPHGPEAIVGAIPLRVTRGGAYLSPSDNLRCAFRLGAHLQVPDSGIGFRCVRKQ